MSLLCRLLFNIFFHTFEEHVEIEEVYMIYGKLTTKSRGNGNITYKHIKSAYNVLSVSIQFIDMFYIISLFYGFLLSRKIGKDMIVNGNK